MRSLDFRRYVLGVFTAVAMLTGCGGSQPPIGTPGLMPQSAFSRAVAPWMRHFVQDDRVATIHDDRTPSWDSIWRIDQTPSLCFKWRRR